MKKLFHGSLDVALRKLRPLSHFGEFEVALVAIGAHLYLDDEDGTPTMYEWNMPSGNMVRIEDIGTPNPQGILLAYLNSPSADAEAEVHRRYISNYDEAEGLAVLKKLCKGKDIDVFEYENKVEGGGTSYCAVAAVVPTKRYPVTKAQVAKAFLDVPSRNWGYSDEAVEAARVRAAADLSP